MLLGGWGGGGGRGGGIKGPRSNNMPRAPRNVNPALATAYRLYPTARTRIQNGKLTNNFATCANAKHHGSLVITAEFA